MAETGRVAYFIERTEKDLHYMMVKIDELNRKIDEFSDRVDLRLSDQDEIKAKALGGIAVLSFIISIGAVFIAEWIKL